MEPVSDLGPTPRWTLADYHRKCAGMFDERRYRAIVTDGRNLVIYDRNRRDLDTAVGAWQRRWSVMARWCAGILVFLRYADMPYVRCDQKVGYFSGLRDHSESSATAREGDPDFEYWPLDNPYMKLYLFHRGLHRMRLLELEVRQRRSGRNALFVGWHNLEMFAVPPQQSGICSTWRFPSFGVCGSRSRCSACLHHR